MEIYKFEVAQYYTNKQGTKSILVHEVEETQITFTRGEEIPIETDEGFEMPEFFTCPIGMYLGEFFSETVDFEGEKYFAKFQD